MTGGPTYVVADIEANGPYPAENAMMSLGAVAVSDALDIVSTFSVNLLARADSVPNMRTLAWFETEAADAYAAAQENPVEPEKAVASFVGWVLSLPAPRIFAAHPVIFDGGWIDTYLELYSPYRLFDHATHAKPLFARTGLDLPSLVMGATGMPFLECHRGRLNARWFDTQTHSHCALDDAMGYAALLINALKIVRGNPVRKTPLSPGKITESAGP
ncbi:hypothetical protein BH10PSE7_BH10PSE7_25900 [soil metagenome]